MVSYLLFEVRRTLRNPRFLVMTLLMPVMMNIVFVQLNKGRLGDSPPAEFASHYMMNMAAFATVSACLSTAGHRLSQERGSGWFQQLTLTPLTAAQVVLGKLLSAVSVGVPAVLAVFVTGSLFNGVRMAPERWALALLVVAVGSLSFSALGVVIGLTTTGETSYAASMIALMFFALLGGLWLPAEVLPGWVASLSTLTPSFQVAESGRTLISGGLPGWQTPAVFAVWTAAFAALALAAFRRAARKR
ncbi:ABC transporter permease [Streptomyces sp. NPDC048659]|uniref:ABC transporter permease n=1 Tax=Streptomyces sp. NPDC048659 TaxID=3155489 RepID=UPI003443A840